MTWINIEGVIPLSLRKLKLNMKRALNKLILYAKTQRLIYAFFLVFLFLD